MLDIQALKTLVYGPPTLAGVAVSEELATSISGVKRAISIYSDTVAGLDCSVYQRTGGTVRKLETHPVSLLLRDPNDRMNGNKFMRLLVTFLKAAGNTFAEIERATDDTPIGLHPIHWRNIRVMQDPDGTVYFELLKESKRVESKDMVAGHEFSWNGITGVSPIQAARETLGLTIAQERYASTVFASGGVPRGFLKLPLAPTPDVKASAREAWQLIHGGVERSNEVGFLGPGTEWVSTNFTPEDCALLGSRAFQIQEIARIFGVPENLLFSGTQSYNADQEGNAQFYQLGLKSVLENLETEFECKLLTRSERLRGLHVKFDVTGFKAGWRQDIDSCSRAVLTGLMTQNEARARLGLNPQEGGDVLLVPMNLAVVDDGMGGTKTTGDLKPVGGTEQKALTVLEPAQAALPAPAAAPEPVREIVPAALREATRAVLVGEIGRALRRQAKSGPKSLELTGYLVEAIGPAYRSYLLAHEQRTPIEDFARRWLDHTADQDLNAIKPEDMLCLI